MCSNKKKKPKQRKKHKTMEQTSSTHGGSKVFGISNPISYFGATGEKRKEIK